MRFGLIDVCTLPLIVQLMKHSQCFDVAVGYNDELAMASKDYKVYVYRLGEGLNSTGPSDHPPCY